MPLIAFDGTWNADETDVTQDTNVARWAADYDGPVEYLKGVGTRLGHVGRVIGGLTGAGADDRIDEALAAFEKWKKAGETAVDVVGFSRGAALALDFCNQLQNRYPAPGFGGVRVRFLALFDVVASFGLPGNEINLGHDLRLADLVGCCCHAMALDEQRGLFPLTRPKRRDAAAAAPPLFEVWFRGVHSDVGGGNGKLGLSSIALVWMMRRAEANGVKWKPEAIERWSEKRNPDEPLFRNKDMGREERRKLYAADVVHESVRARAGAEYLSPLPTMCVVGDDLTYKAQTWGDWSLAQH